MERTRELLEMVAPAVVEEEAKGRVGIVGVEVAVWEPFQESKAATKGTD